MNVELSFDVKQGIAPLLAMRMGFAKGNNTKDSMRMSLRVAGEDTRVPNIVDTRVNTNPLNVALASNAGEDTRAPKEVMRVSFAKGNKIKDKKKRA